MPERTCSIPECSSPVAARGWCKRHWQRWKRSGLPNRTWVPITPGERFWAKVLIGDPEDCWLWTAYKQKSGYGKFTFDGKSRLAHRVAYERFIGPIPDGLVLDHLCRNPACVNPAHLEPVTQTENIRRAARSHRTACIRGHEYTDANTHWTKSGSPVCRVCARLRRSLRAGDGYMIGIRAEDIIAAMEQAEGGHPAVNPFANLPQSEPTPGVWDEVK